MTQKPIGRFHSNFDWGEHTWLAQGFKGKVVTQELQCLHWGSLEITHRVPLINFDILTWVENNEELSNQSTLHIHQT